MKKEVDSLIKEAIKPYKKLTNQILHDIKKYDRICVFRHVRPDFDAIGTQLGLVTWIKDNFPNKDVKAVGENHITLTPNCFPYMDEVSNEWFEKPFLAIVVDTAETERISDERFKKGSRIIKIDHHPNIKPYGKVILVNDEAIAASEIVGQMLLSFDSYVLTKETAKWLYIALAGDSNRFMFASTTPASYALAKELALTGINVGDIHRIMYAKKIEDMDVIKYIMNNYHLTEHGVAYYILSSETLNKFGLKPEQGKENINIFDHYDKIHIWVAIYQDINKNVWRVSIRSSGTPINKVASMFEGGGHAQASGAKLKSLDELDGLITALDNLLVK